MSLPVFIDIAETEQITEIRRYLHGKGAEITEEPTGHGLVAELSDIIRAAPVCWKEGNTDADVETVINGVVALLLYVPSEQAEPLIKSLCDSMSITKSTPARIKILSNLFYGLDEKSPNRYYVYISLIRLAAQGDLLYLVHPNLDDVKAWLAQWDVTLVQRQQLLRALYEAFVGSQKTDKATKTMIELLGTYTEENASQARDDAHKCIVSCLGDPKYYLLDHLLTLKPVKFLEGELIHDLLTIFVSGKLSEYMEFYDSNTDFVRSIGLSHEQSQQKMRLLTFMQMAENKSEIQFETIMKELDLNEDDVESFVIDVVATKVVRAKIDQMARKVVLSSTTHRTFGRQQWQLLRQELLQWQGNLNDVLGSLQSVLTQH
jgi:translation initiation factor 3 subunit M